MTTIMTVLIRTMGVTRRVIHMAKILKSCAGVTQVTFQLGLAYCRTIPISRGQPVTGTGVLYPNFVAQRTFSERTDILSPRSGKEAPNAEARRREYPHHSITKLVGFRIDQREIRHVVPFAIGQPNTIAAPGVVGLPLGHSRRVIDGPGHIPAIDLDGETVSRVAAWAADFVLKGLDPISSLVIESRKHLRRPPPDCRRMLKGSDSKENHRRKYQRSVDHPRLRTTSQSEPTRCTLTCLAHCRTVPIRRGQPVTGTARSGGVGCTNRTRSPTALPELSEKRCSF